MLKQACLLCKVVGAIAIIGTLNWGLIGIAQINLVEQIFGIGTTVTRIVYILVGVSGLAMLLSFVMVCPACKKG